MKIWGFLSNKKNQQTLRWVGGAITAIATSGWALWQHMNPPVAKPEISPLPAVVAPAPSSSVKPPQTIVATPLPPAQKATAGNGGIAVNASGNARVDIKQHNSR